MALPLAALQLLDQDFNWESLYSTIFFLSSFLFSNWPKPAHAWFSSPHATFGNHLSIDPWATLYSLSVLPFLSLSVSIFYQQFVVEANRHPPKGFEYSHHVHITGSTLILSKADGNAYQGNCRSNTQIIRQSTIVTRHPTPISGSSNNVPSSHGLSTKSSKHVGDAIVALFENPGWCDIVFSGKGVQILEWWNHRSLQG